MLNINGRARWRWKPEYLWMHDKELGIWILDTFWLCFQVTLYSPLAADEATRRWNYVNHEGVKVPADWKMPNE